MNREDRKEYIAKFRELANLRNENQKETADNKNETVFKTKEWIPIAEPDLDDKPKAEQEEVLTCPWCGKDLVLRTAKKGNHIGKQFYGCSGFPKCRYVKNL